MWTLKSEKTAPGYTNPEKLYPHQDTQPFLYVQNLEHKIKQKVQPRTKDHVDGGTRHKELHQSITKHNPFQIYPSASKSIIRELGLSFLPKTHCLVVQLGCFISEHHFHMLIKKNNAAQTAGFFTLLVSLNYQKGKTIYKIMICVTAV